MRREGFFPGDAAQHRSQGVEFAGKFVAQTALFVPAYQVRGHGFVPFAKQLETFARGVQSSLRRRPASIHQLVGNLGERADHQHWTLRQCPPNELTQPADGRRILHRSAAEFHDYTFVRRFPPSADRSLILTPLFSSRCWWLCWDK